MNRRIYTTLASLAIGLSLFGGKPTEVSAQTNNIGKCKDPMAVAKTVVYCERFTNGYLQFRDSMSAPNTMYYVRGEFEAIVFDSYVRVVQKNQEVLTIPRERILYFGTFEFGQE